VAIGETAEIGDDVTLYRGVTLGGTSWSKGKRHRTLGDGCVVGAGAKILGPVRIGRNVKVGANLVVVGNVPEDRTVVGIPAKVVWTKGSSNPNPHGVDLDHHLIPDPVADAVRCLLEPVRLLGQEVGVHGCRPRGYRGGPRVRPLRRPTALRAVGLAPGPVCGSRDGHGSMSPMNLLDFTGEETYFDEHVKPEVESLIQRAPETYGGLEADRSLLRAYLLEPEHLTVLVDLYRYFYYRHEYADALLVADRRPPVRASFGCHTRLARAHQGRSEICGDEVHGAYPVPTAGPQGPGLSLDAAR
jgi:carbonic anhydrase/acetyltransferase-like protein (isoleucine patch superfamily)